jgi:hypothetical protein
MTTCRLCFFLQEDILCSRDSVQEADSTRASELMRLRDSLGLISLGICNFFYYKTVDYVTCTNI